MGVISVVFDRFCLRFYLFVCGCLGLVWLGVLCSVLFVLVLFEILSVGGGVCVCVYFMCLYIFHQRYLRLNVFCRGGCVCLVFLVFFVVSFVWFRVLLLFCVVLFVLIKVRFAFAWFYGFAIGFTWFRRTDWLCLRCDLCVAFYLCCLRFYGFLCGFIAVA